MLDLGIEQILPNGDCAVLIRFVESEQRLAGIHALAQNLMIEPLPEMVNTIPAIDSLVLMFGQPIPLNAAFLDDMEQRIAKLTIPSDKVKTHIIPVCYDPSLAPDLHHVCEMLELTIEQLIAYHTKPSYQVDMLGFLPGFAYLSGNHQVLNLPRKATPSLNVPVGSIALADCLTGIYSLASPGGWHVIGSTPKKLLNWDNESAPMLLNPLSQVEFKSIDLQQYKTMISADVSGAYAKDRSDD